MPKKTHRIPNKSMIKMKNEYIEQCNGCKHHKIQEITTSNYLCLAYCSMNRSEYHTNEECHIIFKYVDFADMTTMS